MNFLRQNIVTILLVVYLITIVALMIVRNISITPDRLFIILLFAAIIVGRLKSFVRDWVPFLALILAYEMLRGFADNHFAVHVKDLVAAEKFIFFGFLPTEVLQGLFYHAGQVRFYDVAATIIYFLHFPLPLLTAFFLWIKDKSHYYRFVAALVLLSFSGFITYLFFPAAPPWYASEQGLISITKITNLVVAHLGWVWDLSYYYSRLNPNPVAAMPSLHAAYPMLVFLALFRYSKKLGLLFAGYLPIVWFSIVYLGEHYFIDVFAGIAYAFAAYYLVYNLATVKNFVSRLKPGKRSGEA